MEQQPADDQFLNLIEVEDLARSRMSRMAFDYYGAVRFDAAVEAPPPARPAQPSTLNTHTQTKQPAAPRR
jgi:hypothetical protein